MHGSDSTPDCQKGVPSQWNKSNVPNSKLLGLTLLTASPILPSLATRLAHVWLVLAPEHAALITGYMSGEVKLIGPVLSATWTPEEKLNTWTYFLSFFTFGLEVDSPHQSGSA